jgi:methyl coenzyme M reductase beta subunit
MGEKWRITVRGLDLVNPPAKVADEIKRLIEEEEKETGEVTLMKAYREAWRKVETMMIQVDNEEAI